MGSNTHRTLIIKNGTLIDGTGRPESANDAVVIEGNRIRSVGPIPPDINLDDPNGAQVIDAQGKWVMPGLIDGHCHLSFGAPKMPHIPSAKGTTSSEFSTLRSAMNAQRVLRSGVTSISVPGGAWFIDVALRDAINAGLMVGPRIFTSGRFIVTYGSILDNEPSWVGIPEHSNGVLANTATEMITESRRQLKHGVDFIKLADSTWGDFQTLSEAEMKAVVEEAHRRNSPVTIHSRGSGSTRAAARAGVDWILHADLATEADLDVIAEAGIPIMPTLTSIVLGVETGLDRGMDRQLHDILSRNVEKCGKILQKEREMGIKVLTGTDTGNGLAPQYGEDHAYELELLVRYGGYSPMDAIVCATKNNALTVGLENDLGVIESGKLADIIILNENPLADIRCLRNGRAVTSIIKDGELIDINGVGDAEDAKLHLKTPAKV